MSIVGIFALCRVSVKEMEKPIVQKNSVCLLCGNAGNANLNKKKNYYTSIYNFFQYKSTLRL